MRQKYPAAISALIIVLALILTINYFKPNSTTDLITRQTLQTINQPELLTYTGKLISFSYTTDMVNGSNSTELHFYDKIFMHLGKLSLSNYCNYNVTYYADHPEQAIDVVDISTQTP